MEAQGKAVKSQGSMDVIVADIRIIRDSRIKDLMRDPDLLNFLEENFDVFALNSIKREFLKRELQELKASTVDLTHYASLIKDIHASGTTIPYDHPLFDAELRLIFQRYV